MFGDWRFVNNMTNTKSDRCAEARLKDAEDRVAEARLSDRMESLVNIRNQQNTYIKEHQHTIGLLELEVFNVRQISEALPGGCFKRTRLEP